MASDLVRSLHRAAPVPYDGVILSHEAWEKKAQFALYAKDPKVYALSMHYKNFKDIPYSKHNPEEESLDAQIMVWLSQCLTGDPAKIMESMACLPGQQGYRLSDLLWNNRT